MPIYKSETIFTDSGVGWVDVYNTLVKGYTDFHCGCGHPIKVSYRKEFKDSKPYEFKIVHRNKSKVYTSKDPDALGVFDRMLKVSVYSKCDFAGSRKTTYSGYYR